LHAWLWLGLISHLVVGVVHLLLLVWSLASLMISHAVSSLVVVVGWSSLLVSSSHCFIIGWLLLHK
jgi:hypothetical protein